VRRRFTALLIGTALVAAAPAVAQAAPRDFTSGSATFCLNECVNDVIWTAHGAPGDSKGNVQFHAPELFMVGKASVDCVFVDANHAVVSGVLENPHPGLEGPYYAIVVEDNGPPRANNPNPDRIQVGTSRFPVDCSQGLEFNIPPVFPVVRGNVVVFDNTP
jgi:hypothetical protein